MNGNDSNHSECDVQRLNDIWNLKKEELGITQESVGQNIGITKAAINGYLKGKTRLNVTVAAGFAQAMECKVFDFSPSLQKEIDHLCLFGSNRAEQTLQLFNILNKNTGWPFASVKLEDIESLSTKEKLKVEGLLEGYISHLKSGKPLSA